MKYVIAFFSIILSSHSMGQKASLVEYKEGPRKLMHLLGDAYMKSWERAYNSEPDTNLQFLTILFSVDSGGKVGDRIIVNMLGDTAKIPALLIDAIRKTDGMWINHTGRTVWVEQSFSHRYKDPGKPQLLLPSRMDIYENWNREHHSDFVRLNPIPCETFVPIYDYGPSSH